MIQYYDPEGLRNPEITSRLRTVLATVDAEDTPFVVFNGFDVDVPSTVKILNELLEGEPSREHFQDPNTKELKKTYRLGEKPQVLRDENPLVPGFYLRGDQSCPITNVSWATLPLKIRQIVYLDSIKTKPDKIRDRLSFKQYALNLVKELLKDDDPFTYLKEFYPGACVEFSEREVAGTLPTLKVSSSYQSIPAKQNPFNIGSHKQT